MWWFGEIRVVSSRSMHINTRVYCSESNHWMSFAMWTQMVPIVPNRLYNYALALSPTYSVGAQSIHITKISLAKRPLGSSSSIIVWQRGLWPIVELKNGFICQQRWKYGTKIYTLWCAIRWKITIYNVNYVPRKVCPILQRVLLTSQYHSQKLVLSFQCSVMHCDKSNELHSTVVRYRINTFVYFMIILLFDGNMKMRKNMRNYLFLGHLNYVRVCVYALPGHW